MSERIQNPGAAAVGDATKPEPVSTPGTPPAPAQRSSQPQQVTAQQFPVDMSGMSTAYSNFARVTGTPEELILDFGLTTQMTPNPTEPVRLTHRLVVNYYTAKRLLGALHMAVQQHENAYGILEVDIQKRLKAFPRTGG
jgi:hypothetical protein